PDPSLVILVEGVEPFDSFWCRHGLPMVDGEYHQALEGVVSPQPVLAVQEQDGDALAITSVGPRGEISNDPSAQSADTFCGTHPDGIIRSNQDSPNVIVL